MDDVIASNLETSHRPDVSGMLDPFTLYFKIYGERNSGTNFVERLVKTNFAVHTLVSNSQIYSFLSTAENGLDQRAAGRLRSAAQDLDFIRLRTSDFGWKHGCPPLKEIMTAPHRDHTCFACIAKHPVSWLQSLVRHPYNPINKAPKNFSAFIRYEWPLTGRDNMPGVNAINVVELWNAKNQAFLELATQPVKAIVTTYEALMVEPEKFLRNVGQHLLKKVETFSWDLPSTKGDKMDFEGYRAKYDLNNVRNLCSAEDFDFIMQRVDQKVMKALGYPLS